jgi:hypothetical protein
MGIPVCIRAGIAKIFAYGDPRLHNEIVRILGATYIPLFTTNAKKVTDIDPAPSSGKKVIGCTSLGQSGPHTFCAMENSAQSQDLLYAPVMFDLNELLEVVKRAWLPLVKKSDPDKLDRYRYDSIMW